MRADRKRPSKDERFASRLAALVLAGKQAEAHALAAEVKADEARRQQERRT